VHMTNVEERASPSDRAGGQGALVYFLTIDKLSAGDLPTSNRVLDPTETSEQK